MVGAGDVSLARSAARGVDAFDVERALHEAIGAGIDVIDVAAEPDAEHLVGEAVRALRVRDRAIVACRMPDSRGLQNHVEASLRATRLEVLPLVQLPLQRAPSPDLAGACERLVREGKVLRWSLYLEAYDEENPITADWLVATSVPFSVCERSAEPLLAGCVLARRPLAGGGLAGALGPGVKLSRTDDRLDMPFEPIAVGVAKLAALVKREPPAARSCDPARAQLAKNVRPEHLECMTVAELALRFAIDRGAIVLPRLHRREHVAEAIAAASAPPLSIDVPILDI